MKQERTHRPCFLADIDKNRCIGCGDCALRCPESALTIEVEKEGTLPLELCVGCGLCETKCPMGAIKERKKATLHLSLCAGCGDCIHVCPTRAISLERRDSSPPDPVRSA